MQNRTLVAGGADYPGSQALKVLVMVGFRPAMSNGFLNRSPEFRPLGALGQQRHLQCGAGGAAHPPLWLRRRAAFRPSFVGR